MFGRGSLPVFPVLKPWEFSTLSVGARGEVVVCSAFSDFFIHVRVGLVVPRSRVRLRRGTCTSTGMIVDLIVYSIEVFRFFIVW